MRWAFCTSTNPLIPTCLTNRGWGEVCRNSRLSVRCNGLENRPWKRIHCNSNEVSSDEDEDDLEEGGFQGCKWDFRISKGGGRCGKDVWFFRGASGVEGNFWDNSTWTGANWVRDGSLFVSSIPGGLERCWRFPCSWFLIVLWLVGESKGEEDDSELDKVEKLSFGLPASEFLVFS